MEGESKFHGENLTEAREARGITASTLAELVGTTPTTISRYEHNKTEPNAFILSKISSCLNLKNEFFYKPILLDTEEFFFFRSLSSATKRERLKAEWKTRWAKAILKYEDQYLNFPSLNLPNVDVPDDPFVLTYDQIEKIAGECRKFWNLGMGPISNMTLLLENNGIIIIYGKKESEKLSGHVYFSKQNPRPIILINDHSSPSRVRFSVAHELGHIILHRRLSATKKGLFYHKELENQAFYFAGAFLLPKAYFMADIKVPTLDAFLNLKQKWNVSIGGMIKRAENLGLFFGEDALTRIWMNYNRRGWRTNEPLDDYFVREEPTLIKRGFEILIKHGGEDALSDILGSLPYSQNDIEEILGYTNGTLISALIGGIRKPTITPKDPKKSGNVYYLKKD